MPLKSERPVDPFERDAAGLVDEVTLHIAPIRLEAVTRLFEHLDKSRIGFALKETATSTLVTHVTYLVTSV